MYKIEAMLRRDRVDAVKRALIEQGFEGIAVGEANGYGWQLGAAASCRAMMPDAPLTQQAQIELSVADPALNRAIDCIVDAAGEPGCAKISVTSQADAIEISPGSTSAPQPRSGPRPRRAVTAEAYQAIGKPWGTGRRSQLAQTNHKVNLP
jgi:nitrogen regulatory protein PII